MAWQDVNRIERDGNVWILRFNAKYGDFTVGTTAGRIRMSVEDGRITVRALNGIGYVDPAECAAYANALLHAAEAAGRFQKIMDGYADSRRLTVGK